MVGNSAVEYQRDQERSADAEQRSKGGAQQALEGCFSNLDFKNDNRQTAQQTRDCRILGSKLEGPQVPGRDCQQQYKTEPND